MLQAARGSDTGDETMLHHVSFAKALTDDVRLYDIVSEARLSTNYDDVFLTKDQKETDDWDEESSRTMGMTKQLVELRKSLSQPLTRRFTVPAIDNFAGTYRSKTLMVVLWASFIVTYFGSIYGSLNVVTNVCHESTKVYKYSAGWGEQSAAIRCETAESVLRWLVIFVLMRYANSLMIRMVALGM